MRGVRTYVVHMRVIFLHVYVIRNAAKMVMCSLSDTANATEEQHRNSFGSEDNKLAGENFGHLYSFLGEPSRG